MTAAMACCTAANEIGYGNTRRISFVESDVSSDERYHTSSKAKRRTVRLRMQLRLPPGLVATGKLSGDGIKRKRRAMSGDDSRGDAANLRTGASG